ncbi:enoyl-CoA hydratase/isomerase family protein [Bacillus sp. OK048]|uniref:enoyl-CoA hydratase/isomerase family protein n=1 Tax=Bacillus sp. OK048 TaxID=1882761 RepID=UPI00088AF279|nr:enoyl-CoA hydratase/isomerase family protein [Bacillus sp. OK048]SDL95922.1 2-(1,2-epoxy-1,2-dihydrophenyl)acetyl-CoA isomerase [Bacillus sp. OK048]
MEFQHIKASVENQVCLVKLNRPEIRNAIVVEMREELIELFKSIDRDDEIRVVVLTGEGKAFSAGGDLSTLRGIDAVSGRKRLRLGHDMIKAVLNLEKPVIAAVNGAAAGAGISLALACDMVFASRSSFFVQSFSKVGLVPDLGITHLLPKLIGRQRALELMFTGEQITAEQAYQLGIINRITENDSLLDEVYSVAQKLVDGPGMSMGFAKKLVNRSIHADLDETFELESFAQGLCFESKDLEEGVNAFYEKRNPIFNRE